jgi:DNA-binding NarL/FixJ family response regulator
MILAVKEMMSRGWDVYEIASKLKLDVTFVQSIIDLLT